MSDARFKRQAPPRAPGRCYMQTSLSGDKNGYDERMALGASLFLHALLFMVLSSNADFTPLLGRETRIDLLWLAAAPAAPAALAKSSPGRLAPLSRVLPRRPLAATPKAPPPSGVLLTPGAKASLPVDGARQGSRGGIPGAIEPFATGTPPASGREKPGAHSAAVTQEREAASEAAPPAAPPPVPTTALPHPPAVHPAADPAASPPGKTVPAAAKVAANEPGPQTARLPVDAAPRPTSGGNPAREKEEPPQHVARPDRLSPAAGTPDKEPQQPSPAPQPEMRGLVVASLQGDLKLISSGDSVKISVLFRELPRSRRNRTPSRSEARRLQNITPVCAEGPGRTSEAVIEKSGEGVYVFSAEPRGAATAQASFTLRIYDSGTGKKVAELGRRSISQKSVVAKVLMPEALLWDDDSAFTGSLQDSESTTKFNSQSGLYWKEYDD